MVNGASAAGAGGDFPQFANRRFPPKPGFPPPPPPGFGGPGRFPPPPPGRFGGEREPKFLGQNFPGPNFSGQNLSGLVDSLNNSLSQFLNTGSLTNTTNGITTGNGTGPSVVVVDQTDVAKAGIDLDGDKVSDVAHGTIVGNFIKSGLPNANISNVELPDYEVNSLVNAFNGVTQRIDGGEKIDAVNFSAQTFNKIGDLAKVTGLPLDQSNLGQYKEEIRNRLFNLTQNPTAYGGDAAMAAEFTQFVPVIQALDNITQRNVPLYIAAGNDGKDQVNLFALANNAQVIGATDATGNKTDFTADNSLITAFTRGTTPVTPLANRSGTIAGVDFTGDNRIDAAANQLSGRGQTFVSGQEVSGTSFASPKALADDFARRGLGASINSLA